MPSIENVIPSSASKRGVRQTVQERNSKTKSQRSAVARFYKYVTYEPNTGCWLWTGATVNGYGVIGVGSKCMGAHRFSLELASGNKPSGVVMHSCDQPACVNPDHLSDGTHKLNMHDMIAKNRQNDFCRQLMGLN